MYEFPTEVVLGRAAAPEELAAPLLFVLVPVPVPVPPEEPPCSEAPLSLPQLLVYHVSIAVLSLGSVHVVAQTVARDSPEAVQTFLQKQDHAVRLVLLPPLHCD